MDASNLNELFVFLLDCGLSVEEYVLARLDDCRELLRVWYQIALKTSKGTIVASLAIFSLALLVLLTLLGCLALSLLGTVAVRHYILSHAPGNQLLPLTFNIMPFETELWRLRRVDSFVSQVAAEPLPLPPHGDANSIVARRGAIDAQLPFSVAEQAAALKMSLVQQYVQSTLATSTLLIPTLVEREVFPPGGGVSIEALFQQQRPMFNARGVYDAKVQLVFLKEDVGCDVSLVLESAVLFSEDPDVSQALSALDVLLKTTTSLTFTTGEKEKSWLMHLISMSLRVAFFVPLWMYENFIELLRRDVFPAVDASTEVGVVADVYNGFEPPLALQPRLRAINFTLYQQVGDTLHRARLRRMHFFSSVHLTGLAYYFSTYAFTSFICTTLLLFVCFCATAVWVAFAAGALIGFLYLRRTRSVAEAVGSPPDTDEEEEDDGKSLVGEKRLLFSHPSPSASLHAESFASGLQGSRRMSSFRVHEPNSPLTKEKKST
ncbi:uncharacterized protein Tco025E_04506 [Trypanosoma conorhini]|uniref:Seipin n=1 Tax=Trypanosoma conorhini TaxID=83891 RepID=A0A422PKY9_9TRYP|nr:uncharacterized protein Tco025E_04506 [Trypanosoma conorhini]RNF18389.1 hypothetical protein Tco025E_04506 [Trypanosoma conorhini]